MTPLQQIVRIARKHANHPEEGPTLALVLSLVLPIGSDAPSGMTSADIRDTFGLSVQSERTLRQRDKWPTVGKRLPGEGKTGAPATEYSRRHVVASIQRWRKS